MSGFVNNLREHREEIEERREARRERHGHGGHRDNYDDYESERHGRRHHYEDEEPRRPEPYSSQGQARGYAPPSGPPPSARGTSGFGSLGGLDRGDFASDADIDQMVAAGEFEERQGRQAYGYGGGRGERRYDAPSGPSPGQEYARYDAPSGPPPGRGYQSQEPRQEPHQQGYGSGGAYASSYGGEPDRRDQYGSQQAQGRPQYDSSREPPSGYGRGQGNTPSGGFSASRDGEERYGGGPPNNRNEPPRRGEAASYYNQQGSSDREDRYGHLAGLAQEHGNEDPEMYRQATQGLQERIQSQAQSRRPGRDDEDNYKSHVDAHRKAYGEDDHGPMDADAIGAAAALEAFKQTAAAVGSSNAPAGAFQAGKASGGPGSSSKPGRAEEEEGEEETTAARAGASGGLQDKLMALAMSHAGKLFDKKNAGSSASGGDKAQAMQSAAATAMQLFAQYQTKGKLDSSDMSKVMGLAMNMF